MKLVYTAIGGGARAPTRSPGAAPEVRKAVLTINMTHRASGAASPSRPSRRSCARRWWCCQARVKVGLGAQREIRAGAGRRRRPRARRARRAGGARAAQHPRHRRGDLHRQPGAARADRAARLRARRRTWGVTSQAIADTLRIATNGDYDQGLPKMNLSQRQVPVVVKLADDARADLELLARLPVPARAGRCRCPTSPRWRSIPARPRSPATTGCATSTSRSSSTACRSARSRRPRSNCPR